jgi:hypothetical protein
MGVIVLEGKEGLKAKIISITIFSFFIFFIFFLICSISISALRPSTSHHEIIFFLGIFLILAMIPIIVFILIKKNIKIYFIIIYLIYFFITSHINIVLSTMFAFWIDGIYTFDEVLVPSFFDQHINFFYFILFLFQFPVIILCLIIKKIHNYNGTINFKYFLKNPLIYILISFNVLIWAYIISLIIMR